MHYFPGRFFRLWDYSVSHSRLLIRSVNSKTGRLPALDIVFYGMRLVNMPDILGEISIQTVPLEDTTNTRYIVYSTGGIYTIEALIYSVKVWNRDYFESPLDTI